MRGRPPATPGSGSPSRGSARGTCPDLREVRDQDHLLEELAHPEELLDEQLPGDLRVEGPEVALVDEERLHPAVRPARLGEGRELLRDREAQGRVDLGLLTPAELPDVVPKAVDGLHEDPDPVAAALLLRLELDPAEPPVRELREVLRRLDLELREELVDRVHDDPALVEHAVHEEVGDLEAHANLVELTLGFPQASRLPLEVLDLSRELRRLSLGHRSR